MTAELGHFALIAAFILAGLQMSVPLYGAHKGDVGLMDLARATALGQFALILLAFAALVNAFVVSDFSVLNVAQNSHSLKPMLYKVSGAWGNHEGSLLLWVLILSLFGAMVASFGRNLPPSLRARTLSVQGMIAFGFMAFMLFTSNPFERIVPPADGQGLNPLLRQYNSQHNINTRVTATDKRAAFLNLANSIYKEVCLLGNVQSFSASSILIKFFV